MSELLSSLGLNIKLFIPQVINFCIVLFVLYRFAYKPVLKMLDERTTKIEKGLADAEESQKKLEDIVQKEKEVIIEAKKQAKDIIEKAQGQAQVQREELIALAKDESQKMITKAQKSIEEEKNKMVSEAKKEIASLVSLAVEKVIGEKIDERLDAKIIADVINTK
ncbi:MAG: F0F1 ATP synthase subunit B [Parcubacteria group bacterium]|jgi:F-type H+-transporting ATPase subunit b